MSQAASQESKQCACCGRNFFKRGRDSSEQWNARLYCSISCRNKSTSPIPIHLRFWEKVERKSDGECWEWAGSKDGKGYGTISLHRDQAPQKAHRISWEIHFGKIPEGGVICHLCDNPGCVNPSHLLAADQKENMLQASERGRLNPISLKNLNHEKKLSPSQIREIKQLKFVAQNGRGDGVMVKDVASKYGVSRDLITAIKQGRY